MINLIIAAASGVLTSLLFAVWLTPGESVIPGVAMLCVVYFVIARRTYKRVEGTLLAAQKDLMSGRIDKAIATMETARSFARWQFFVDKALNSQIGAIHFLREDFNKAMPMLSDSDPRNWVARVMLAVLHYKKKDLGKMDQEFDAASRFNKKQGVLYGVWAWCHWKNDNTQRAIQVLSQGDTALEGKDERLRQNLLNLQNGKKMKMKGYAEQWYQFHLEKPPQPKPQVRYR